MATPEDYHKPASDDAALIARIRAQMAAVQRAQRIYRLEKQRLELLLDCSAPRRRAA